MVSDILSSADPIPKVGVVSCSRSRVVGGRLVGAGTGARTLDIASSSRERHRGARADYGDQPQAWVYARRRNTGRLPTLVSNSALENASDYFFVRSLEGLLLYPGFEELVLTLVERMTDLASHASASPGMSCRQTFFGTHAGRTRYFQIFQLVDFKGEEPSRERLPSGPPGQVARD